MKPFHQDSCSNLPTSLQTCFLSQSSKQFSSNLIILLLKTFQGLLFTLRIKYKPETLVFKALNNLALPSSAVHVKLIFFSLSQGLRTPWCSYFHLRDLTLADTSACHAYSTKSLQGWLLIIQLSSQILPPPRSLPWQLCPKCHDSYSQTDHFYYFIFFIALTTTWNYNNLFICILSVFPSDKIHEGRNFHLFCVLF